jgi:hypothetical protein
MLRAFLIAGLVFAATPVLAQNPLATSPADPTVPATPPDAASPPPEKIAPPSMSDRLAQQHGTVTPPNVDPGIAITPPATGRATTPVIPPPGSPGGNGSVIPK